MLLLQADAGCDRMLRETHRFMMVVTAAEGGFEVVDREVITG